MGQVSSSVGAPAFGIFAAPRSALPDITDDSHALAIQAGLGGLEVATRSARTRSRHAVQTAREERLANAQQYAQWSSSQSYKVPADIPACNADHGARVSFIDQTLPYVVLEWLPPLDRMACRALSHSNSALQ
eukprot:1802552-Pyramimonas_sp.AAC.2